jgi:glycosyltransferase involved in cell wall biosynthesis
MDFMDEESAGLVRYRLIDTPADAGFYAGGRWAEADVEHAAELLSRLIRDPEHRRTMGEKARAKAEVVFSPERWLAATTGSLGPKG